MVSAPPSSHLRNRPYVLATGFYFNQSANEQNGQDERGMRHLRNGFANNGAYSLNRDERRIARSGFSGAIDGRLIPE